ncbi:hypothetical protein JJB09_25520 [Rhizobium sp. KVB221]|uniref:Uncharacterized protein n=1 Tax=Rhizobium setariae TaxID=2801340 RepID=A0A936YX11_9HYPH|nr:hypothetical protein [Rhizobium setariae]MBL0375375.1 hypothetical protein [Rhizobium setariae]
MAHYQGNPAAGVMMEVGSLLSVVAAVGPCLAEGIHAVASDISQARYESRYHDALSRAIQHGQQLQIVAEAAIERVGELEAEIAKLRDACAQRQEIIQMLAGRK